MALRFIIGKAGTGKTRLCMEEIIKKQQLGMGRQVLLVPEQFTSQAERDLTAMTKNSVLLSAQVLSFGRLAHQVFAKNGLGGRIPLEDIGKSMALQKILLQEKDRIVYFRHVMDKSGFVEQLNLTITEFFQYQIQPEQLRLKALEEGLSQSAKDKLMDSALIFEAYLAFLNKDYLSGDETLTLLSRKLQEANSFSETEIWLDAFHGFTPQELSVIGHLIRQAKQVTITLLMDEGSFLWENLPPSASFYEPYVTKNALCRLAAEVHAPLAPPVFLRENHRAKTEALLALENNFFQGYYKKCSLFESVFIHSCPTKAEEIAFAAGKIVRLAREKGLRFRDMAIVTNAMESYEKNLRGILREYGIPHFIDSRREISFHPLITLVTSLLDILVYDFRYEGVFSYLKTRLTPFTREEIDVLENYVLAYGIKSYKWKKAEWTYGAAKEGSVLLQTVNDLRERFLQPFAPFFEAGEKKTFSLRRLTSLILTHLQELNTPERLSLWADDAMKRGETGKGEEHRQIWQMLTEVLETASAILAEDEVSLQEGAKILTAGLAKCTMGVIPPTVDCLLVGDIERSRLPEIKVLFVLGVNEGVLPAPSQPQGIFTDGERQALAKTGLELAGDGKRKAFEEQFLIYRGLTRPSEQLYLTFANGDQEGKALFPSPLIDRLCRMDPNLLPSSYDGFCLEESVPAAAFHLLGAEMQKDNMSPLWQDIYSFFDSNEAWEQRLNLLKRGLRKEKQQQRLSPKTMKALYGKQIFSSVSRLERFAACPFSFFAEYGLKAEERKLYQLRTPDLGSLFHQVLELFSTRLATEGIEWDSLTKEKTTALIHEAVDTAAPHLGNQILMDTAANQYLIQRLKRISTRAAWTLVEHLKCGDFTPAGYEIGFGSHEALPPIVIALSEGKSLVLSGKIDRVDLLDANGCRYAKIIDYKSGSKAFNFQDIYYGLQLQLLIYLDAYLKHYEKTVPPVKPGGVFYFRINDPTLSLEKELSAEEIQQALYEKMQMSGLLLENDAVLQGIDHVFISGTEGNASTVVPVGFTKKGEPSATSYLASQDQYDKLLSFVVERAAKLGNSMKDGVITPAPYRKKDQSPCSYCRFKPICRYDVAEEPHWRDLKKIGKKDFWEKIGPDVE